MQMSVQKKGTSRKPGKQPTREEIARSTREQIATLRDLSAYGKPPRRQIGSLTIGGVEICKKGEMLTAEQLYERYLRIHMEVSREEYGLPPLTEEDKQRQREREMDERTIEEERAERFRKAQQAMMEEARTQGTFVDRQPPPSCPECGIHREEPGRQGLAGPARKRNALDVPKSVVGVPWMRPRDRARRAEVSGRFREHRGKAVALAR